MEEIYYLAMTVLVRVKKSGPIASLDYLDLRIKNKAYYKFK